ncbi:MAG: hypothetical protein IPN42_02370 [Methylococcaceae bacterium]|nr:hypothetical protein [Methylococcaceae bacterium]
MNGINVLEGLLLMCRYRDGFLMWVLVPTDEILSFASPKESIQRKGDPDTASSCALTFLSGFARKNIPVLLAKCGILAAPLRAIPDKNASARRVITGWGGNL